MISPQKPVKERELLAALRRYDGEWLQDTELALDRLHQRLGHGRNHWAKSAAVVGGLLAGRQADQAFLLQFQEHRAAGHILESAGVISPLPALRDVLRELGAVPARMSVN